MFFSAQPHPHKYSKMSKDLRKEMPRLTEDLIAEVLVKLPVKSLLRLRCVCKSWHDFIKSAYFIERHLKHNSITKNDECILILRGFEDRTISYLSFHSYESLSVVSSQRLQIPEFDYFVVNFCGPCNGLLCISDTKAIALCNPAMREFKVLPRPFSFSERWMNYVSAFGLGFDSTTNDYKVVAVFRFSPYNRDEGDFIDKAGIYNLSTNSWREIEYDHDFPHIPYNTVYGTLFNGAFHWIAWSQGIHSILSFDISTELFRYLELPDDSLVQCGIGQSLTVLNESLALFAWRNAWDDFSKQVQFVDMWVMHEYGVAESWTKHFVIGPVTGIYHPLLLWKNEAILIESTEGKLLSCDLDTHEMNDFEMHGDRETFGVIVYQESLISIK